MYAAKFGVGSHDADLPNALYQVRAAEYQLYWEIFYFISSTVVKCGIGFTCMRLDRRKQVSIPISINMSIMVTVTVLALIFVFANCAPVSASWNPLL